LTTSPDDPYYYLYYGDGPRSPSYLTLERELLPTVGRVLRFDSFSKILSAGIRVGFATGPARLLDAIDLYVVIFLVRNLHYSDS
jgi:tryptophan aminotransferase